MTTNVPERQKQVANDPVAKVAASTDDDIFSKKINACCLDYLLMETVPLSIRVNERLDKISKKVGGLVEVDIAKLKIDDPTSDSNSNSKAKPYMSVSDEFDDLPGTIDLINKSDEMSSNNNLYRIENYGYQLGNKLTECLIYQRGITDINLKFVEVLEIMKFICRDVWKVCFLKQMNNLRTNHIDTFVLIDNSFRPLTTMYSSEGREDTIRKAQPYLQLPCGIIRGILASLGVDAIVKAEVGRIPAVTFNVQTISLNNSSNNEINVV